MTTKLIAFSPEQQQTLSPLTLTSPSFLSYLLHYQNETIRGISVRLPGNFVHYSLLAEQEIISDKTTVGELKMKVLNVVYVTDSQERVEDCVLCRMGVHVEGLHERPGMGDVGVLPFATKFYLFMKNVFVEEEKQASEGGC